MPQLVPTKQVLQHIPVTADTLRRWAKEKLIPPPIRVGRKMLWDLPKLIEAIQKMTG